MKKNIIFIIIALLLLFTAVLIYLCFRSPDILFIKWLDLFGLNYSMFQNINIKLPNIIKYNFTNMLFLLFGYIFVYIIWDNNKKCFLFYISLITLLNIIYEIFTHDISDIITILFTFTICTLVYIIYFGAKYEKK